MNLNRWLQWIGAYFKTKSLQRYKSTKWWNLFQPSDFELKGPIILHVISKLHNHILLSSWPRGMLKTTKETSWTSLNWPLKLHRSRTNFWLRFFRTHFRNYKWGRGNAKSTVFIEFWYKLSWFFLLVGLFCKKEKKR